jgi:hypothetical protein
LLRDRLSPWAAYERLAPLITQRSQVQILPPLLLKVQVRGLITDLGGRAS